MKNIKDFLTEGVDENIDNATDPDEDPLADVRSNSDGRLLSPRNITIFLVIAIIAFFGGYFAAFSLAKDKYSAAEAELSTCRTIIDASHDEISSLKDSIDRLNGQLLKTQEEIAGLNEINQDSQE